MELVRRAVASTGSTANGFQFNSIALLLYMPWVFGGLCVAAIGWLYLAPGSSVFLVDNTVALLVFLGVGFFALGLASVSIRRARRHLEALQALLKKNCTQDWSDEIPVSSSPFLSEIYGTLAQYLTQLQAERQSVGDLRASGKMLARRVTRIYEVLDSLTEGFVALDTSHKVLFANRAASSILNCSSTEAKGRSARDCVVVEGIRVMLNDMQADTGKRSVRSVEVAEDTSKSIPPLTVTLSMGMSENERVSGYALVMRDMSRVRKVERQQAQFVQNLTHELREPLDGLGQSLDSLASAGAGSADPERIRAAIDVCKDIGEYVESLANLTLLESGGSTLDAEKAELSDLLESCVEEARHSQSGRGAALEFSVSKRLPAVLIDPRLMNIAVANVLRVAMRRTPSGESVRVFTGINDHEITISVRDHGPTYSETEIGTLFQKNQGARGGDQKLGSALALPTAYQIARKHGGDLRVAPEADGGNTLTISLPRSRVRN